MSASYSEVLTEMLGAVADKFDKRESSVIYNTLAPAALEFSNIYSELEQIEDEGFADTASMPFLTRRAAERGLTPNEATAAVLKGKFNLEIETGKRFTGLNTPLNYGVYDFIESTTEDGETYYYYKCICETAGESGNEYLGDIIPLDGDITGLTTAVLTEILTHGEDEEDVEDFRTRYFSSINNLSYGGNKAWYKSTVEAIEDVGGCKVYPCTKPDGTEAGGYVKVVIQDSTFGVPAQEVIDNVKNQLDPEEDSGNGVGLAPIGHIVTVTGVSEATIDIAMTVTYESGKSWDDVSTAVNEVIDEYIAELNEDWANQEKLVVRISQIESRCLNVSGILDVTGTTINESTANYVLGNDEIITKGTVMEI